MSKNFVVLRGTATAQHPLLRGVNLETVEYRPVADIEDVCSQMTTLDNLIICGDMPVIENKRGRPRFVENGESRLDLRKAEIHEMLHDRIKRGVMAEVLGTSRETLNKFIALHFPEFHRAKN